MRHRHATQTRYSTTAGRMGTWAECRMSRTLGSAGPAGVKSAEYHEKKVDRSATLTVDSRQGARVGRDPRRLSREPPKTVTT